MIKRLQGLLSEARRSAGRKAAYRTLDTRILPLVQKTLDEGKIVVLLGPPNTGKTVLARKAVGHPKAGDYLGDDLGLLKAKYIVARRDRALSRRGRIVLVGQCWDDVAPALEDLSKDWYRVFRLNEVWGMADPYATRSALRA